MEGNRRRRVRDARRVDWVNNRRLLEPIGDIPPDEFEANYEREEEAVNLIGLKEPSLR